MGYSTTLYAVDLDALGSAIGSNSAELVKRVMKDVKPKRAVKKKSNAPKGPRVKIGKDSQLYLNGEPVTLEELNAALRKSIWRGTDLYLFREPGKRTGRWQKPGAFEQALVLPRHIVGTLYCDDEAELRSGWDDDEMPEEQALQELIAGKFTSYDAYQYGYALERLCLALGTRLANIPGKGRLEALKLDTPLSEVRLPVPIPAYDDFPNIGHLTAAEVQREVDWLGSLDLSFPKSAEIEAARIEFLKCLKKAAKMKHGVVAFYY